MSVSETKLLSARPSERDWAVYRNVRVEAWSTRTTAQEFGISQTRVCQIVKEVGAFLWEAAPVRPDDDEGRARYVATQLAAERIDFLYNEAVSCYYHSKCVTKVTRRSDGKETSELIRTNPGEMRYLNAAGKLLQLALKLPPTQLWGNRHEDLTGKPAAHVMADEVAAENRARAERRAAAAAKRAERETCSAPADEVRETAAEESAASSATVAAMMSCVEESRGARSVETAAARPVQPDEESGKKELTAKQAARRKAFLRS